MHLKTVTHYLFHETFDKTTSERTSANILDQTIIFAFGLIDVINVLEKARCQKKRRLHKYLNTSASFIASGVEHQCFMNVWEAYNATHTVSNLHTHYRFRIPKVVQSLELSCRIWEFLLVLITYIFNNNNSDYSKIPMTPLQMRVKTLILN